MRKGFTLIELLAVIVVLAILALVVTPIVLNIVENAQRGSDERSLEAYAKVMQTTFYEMQVKDPSLTLEEYLSKVDTPSGVSLTYNGSKVVCSEKKVVETVSGTKTIELRNCTVDGRGPYDFINGSAGKKNNSATSSTTKYTIKTTLSNVTISNSATTIKYGESYSATLTPKEGYEINTINITMGGADITSSVYSKGKITIDKVIGNIEIISSGKEISYTITENLTNVNISNNLTTIKYGESYSATLIPNDGYGIKTTKITMGGNNITSSAYKDGKITIEKVTGNIVITSSAAKYSITTNLTQLTIDNTATSIEYGESYSATLTPNDGYGIKTTKVTMGEKDITSSSYKDGKITIEKVTGNVHIYSTAMTQFSMDSWSTVIENVKNGNANSYKVGHSKSITLTSTDEEITGTYTVRIANMSTPEECSTEGFSQTACGFVIEFQNVISTQKMNTSSTNVGGWPASEMYTYVNNDIYNALPSEVKAGIIDTYTVSGYGSEDSSNFISTDKLYLLSTAEVWAGGKSNDTARDVTRQLDYYKNKGVTLDNYSAAMKRSIGYSSWWLRSARSTTNSCFQGVYSGGYSLSYTAVSDSSVSPAFRIG